MRHDYDNTKVGCWLPGSILSLDVKIVCSLIFSPNVHYISDRAVVQVQELMRVLVLRRSASLCLQALAIVNDRTFVALRRGFFVVLKNTNYLSVTSVTVAGFV